MSVSVAGLAVIPQVAKTIIARVYSPIMRRSGPPVVAVEHRDRFPLYMTPSVLVTFRYRGRVSATAPAKAEWYALAVVC